MKRIILLTLLIPVLAHAQRYGHTSGSTFYWNKSGEAQKQDSIRFIQDGTVTLTQSGNTLTISGAASGSATRQTWYDADGDSVVIQLSPQFLYYLQAKDGTTRMFHVDSAGNMFSNKLGIGGTTAGQQQRAFLNVIGFGDTLVTIIGDGNRTFGDSSIMVDAAGRVGIKIAPAANYGLFVSGGSASNIAASSYEIGAGGSGSLNNTSSGSSVSILGGGTYGGGMSVKIGYGSNPNRGLWVGSTTAGDTSAAIISGNGLTKSGYAVFGKLIRPVVDSRAAFNIEFDALADTLLLISNDANATLDSAFMVFANGDADVGGNNLYLGGHRIRSNAAGDSLIFYDGNTMIFAILSDGSTADLVAGTPPTLWRNIPPQEYIWLLRIGVLLLLLLVAFKVYDYAKPRIRKYQTLPGEI